MPVTTGTSQPMIPSTVKSQRQREQRDALHHAGRSGPGAGDRQLLRYDRRMTASAIPDPVLNAVVSHREEPY
jgi:hypothetical protein